MANKKLQITPVVDATQAVNGFDQIIKSAKEMGDQVRQSGKDGSDGLTQLPLTAEKAAKAYGTLESQIIRSTARIKASVEGTGRVGELANLAFAKGLDPAQFEPGLRKLYELQSAQKAVNAGFNDMGMSAKQTTAALRQVPAQFTDIVVSLQGGQNPMQVLLQQGGQLKDVFGGAGVAAKALGGYVLGLVNPLTLAAAAAAALAYGFFKGAEEAQAFNKALVLTGNAAGSSVSQLTAMAERMDALGTTQARATEGLVEFVNAGVKGAAGLERYTLAAINLEKVGGPAIKDTAKAFADLGKDPLQAAIKLDEATNFLTRSTYEQIKSLTEQGRATDAAKVAQDAYADSIEQRTPAVLEKLGAVERAWRAIKAGAAEAADNAIFSIGREDSLPRQLASAQARRAGARAEFNENTRNGGGGLLGQLFASRAKDAEREAEAQINDLNRRLLRETEVAAVLRQQTEQKQSLFAADKILAELSDKKAKQAAEELRVRTILVAAGKDEKTIVDAIAAVRAKFADKSKPDNSAAKALEEEGKLLEKLAGLSGTYYKDLQDRFKLFESGKLSLEDYQKAVAKLNSEQPFSKEAEAAAKEQAKLAKEAGDEWLKGADAYAKWLAELNKGGDAAAKQALALQDESEAAGIAAAKNITLAQAIEEVNIARLQDKRDASASDQERAALDREISERRKLIAEIGNSAARKASEDALKSVDKFLDPAKAEDFGAALTKAFDGAGNSISKMVNLLGIAGQKQAAIAQAQEDASKIEDPAVRLAKQAELNKRSQRESLELYAGLTGAAKGFFEEGTKGYKALEIAETAFRAYQLASDFEKGLSAATVAVASQAQGEPYTAWARMAAMAATMASLGYQISNFSGSGPAGGGDGAKIATGTGTVLGDAEAKSESITRSIDLLGDTAQLQLRTQSGMLDALRSIEARIGGITNQVLRSGAVTGDVASEFGINTGTVGPNRLIGSGLGGSLNLDNILFGGKITNALFGKKTSITGNGLFAGPQDLGSILSGGLNLQDFADTVTKSKFLGITTSNKNSTQYQAADPALSRQFSLVFQDFANALSLAADPLGLELNDVKERISSFVVDIGKIDLKDLTGEEIAEKLGAILGAAADNLATAAIPGLLEFQRVGEGYFETTIRVAAGVETAGAALDLLGITAVSFGDVARKQGDVATEIVRQSVAAFESLDGSISSVGELILTLDGSAEDLAGTYRDLIDVRASIQSIGISGDVLTASLIRGAGGLDALGDSVGTFFDSFLSEEEKLNARRARLQQDAARIGITSLPTDRAGFRDLVTAAALNATTEAGQRFLAQVLGLADAFDEVATSAEAAAEKLAEARRKDAQGLQSAIDSILPKVLTPAQLEAQRYARASDQLAGLGLDINASVLKGASAQAIVDFAQAFVLSAENSDAAKTALLGVAGSLLDLKDAAAQATRADAINGIQGQLKTLRDTIGDTSVIDSFETVSAAFVRNRSELQQLETGLSNLLGTTVKTAQEALADLLQTQKALQSYRTGSLADSITDARLRSLDPASRIASLRGQEAALFGQLSTAADPVSVAQRLQGVVIQRIKEEAALRNRDAQAAADLAKKARDSQIGTLREQISSFERLKRLAQDVSQFTGSLRFSDLSPLAFDQQLGAAKSLFESTLTKAQAGDADAQGLLTGNARAFIEEARSFYASAPEFAAIFGQVTSALDSLGLTGQDADPQLAALQSQLTALEALQQSQLEEQNTAGEELSALQSIDAALLRREQSLESLIVEQTSAAREQIEALRDIVNEQRAQIAQAAEATRRLETQLEELNDTSRRTYNLTALEAENPTERAL